MSNTPDESANPLNWFTSSYSGNGGGNCVKVAITPATVHVQDSKVSNGPVLMVSAGAFAGLVGLVRADG